MIIPGAPGIIPANAFSVDANQPSVVDSGGTGGCYVAGDVLTLVGGTLAPGGTAATFTVTSAPACSVVTVDVTDEGKYTDLPAPVDVPVPTTGGTGTGATIIPPWKPVPLAPAPILNFFVQPSNAEYSWPISPSIVVYVVGNLGIPVDTFTGPVTLAIGNNAGPGVISGTLTRSAVAGVATFNDIEIDTDGTGYTLIASSSDLPFTSNTESAAFNIRPQASGGDKSRIGNYTLHIFNYGDVTPGYYDFTPFVNPLIIDFLLIGGGGAAGQFGGGGAGEFLYTTSYAMSTLIASTVTVGAGATFGGGAAETSILSVPGDGDYSAVPGGNGGGSAEVGWPGASGGGGGVSLLAGGTFAGGTSSAGFNGGSGTGDQLLGYGSGGGGGAGAAGTNGSHQVPGNGGVGISSDLTGFTTWYCGGGAGLATDAGFAVVSGTDGAGSANDGTNGGGGNPLGPIVDGAAGIVMIRYLTGPL